jgi:2-phospho-L-lactate/phosphoenolpyruvate guanylyltransferase
VSGTFGSGSDLAGYFAGEEKFPQTALRLQTALAVKLWLLLPIKPFGVGKGRLATVLSRPARAQLSQQMLAHVLTQTQAANVLAGTLVISRDPMALAQAVDAGALAVREKGRGLNDALSQARAVAVAHGAQAILALPADLPLLTVADVQHLAAAASAGNGVVIAPSRDGGTNALLLRPPQAIDFAFGPESAARHQALAQAAGLNCQLVESPTLAFDVDWPADLKGFSF